MQKVGSVYKIPRPPSQGMSWNKQNTKLPRTHFSNPPSLWALRTSGSSVRVFAELPTHPSHCPFHLHTQTVKWEHFPFEQILSPSLFTLRKASLQNFVLDKPEQRLFTCVRSPSCLSWQTSSMRCMRKWENSLYSLFIERIVHTHKSMVPHGFQLQTHTSSNTNAATC